MLRARAVDQVVPTVPKIEAVERLASCFGPNPLSPKAEEEMIAAVACQESTQTQGIILKANETKTESARCHTVLIRARSSVSHAFVMKQRVETKSEVLITKAPQGGRHKKLSIIVDGA